MLLMNDVEFVVIDANILIGLCAKEPDKYDKAMLVLSAYMAQNSKFYAPHVIVMEVLYVLCNKQKSGSLTDQQHTDSIREFVDFLDLIEEFPGGDMGLAKRAEEIREARGCSHSADGLYLALAEELAKQGATELLTFDEGQAKQAAATVPQVTVNLLMP